MLSHVDVRVVFICIVLATCGYRLSPQSCHMPSAADMTNSIQLPDRYETREKSHIQRCISEWSLQG